MEQSCSQDLHPPDCNKSKPVMLVGEEFELPNLIRMHTFLEHIASNVVQCDKIALYCHDKTITFRQLNLQANQFARAIKGRVEQHYIPLGRPIPCIAIFLPNGIDRVVIQVACLKLGVAYYCLSEQVPWKRRQAAFSLIQPICYIVSQDFVESNDINAPCTFIFESLLPYLNYLSDDNLLEAETLNQTNELPFAVLATSGSTGVPKIVLLSHRNFYNRLMWQWKCLPFQQDDVVCHKTSILFSDGQTELFSALFYGIPCVIIEKQFHLDLQNSIKLIDRYSVTRIVLSPAHLELLLHAIENKTVEGACKSLKLVISSGDCLKVELARRFFNIFNDGTTELANLYGSAEVTGDVCWAVFQSTHDFSKLLNDLMPVGQPIFNTVVYVLEEKVAGDVEQHLSVIPTCESESSNSSLLKTGNVYISGASVCSSITNSSDQGDSISILPNTFLSDLQSTHKISDASLHSTLFCASDFAAIFNDCLYIYGRTSNEWVMFGYRISGTEIDSIVARHPLISHCITLVISVPQKQDSLQYVSYGKDLVTFYTTTDRLERRRPNFRELRAHCAEYLPDFIRPIFCHIDRIPLQSTSPKIDMQKLKNFYLDFYKCTAANTSSTNNNIVTRILKNGVRRQTYDVLVNYLNIPYEHIREDLDFLQLGGNSFKASMCVAELHRMGLKIDLYAFISARSIGQILTMAKYDISAFDQGSNCFALHGLQDTVSLKEDCDHLNDYFQLHTITRSDSDVVLFLTERFQKLDKFYVRFNIKPEHLLNFMQESCEAAYELPCSFVARANDNSERIIAALIAMSSEQLPSGSESLTGLQNFFEYCKRNYNSTVEASQHLTVLATSVAEDIKLHYKVLLLSAMEQKCLDHARTCGFRVVESINTTPVTLQVCSELGYETVSTTSLYDYFKSHGEPFESSDENLVASFCIKQL
jgi:acyl-coenzyme A synthetase/AMP-(fatty) acid ligase